MTFQGPVSQGLLKNYGRNQVQEGESVRPAFLEREEQRRGEVRPQRSRLGQVQENENEKDELPLR